MKELASIFRALADETRLQMLGLILRHEELCVCDFVYVLEITQSKASRHLRYLLNSGLVQDRREAVWIHYRLAEGMDAEHRAIVESVQQALDPKRMDALEHRLSYWLQQKGCEEPPHVRVTLETKKRMGAAL